MRISEITKTDEGFLKHSSIPKLFLDDTIPKFLFTRVFSYSDKQSEKFLSALETLYKDPFIKPILNVIAIQVGMVDDLAIIFSGSAGQSVDGRYLPNKNEVKDRILALTPAEREHVLKIFSLTSSSIKDSLSDFKKIQIHSILQDTDLTSIIAHEFAHLAAELIFDNYSLGYSDLNQKTIYDSNLNSFGLKIAQAYNSLFEGHVYSTVDGKELLNLEAKRVVSSFQKSHTAPKNPKEVEVASQNEEMLQAAMTFEKFLKTFLISSDSYADSYYQDCEMFSRIFEAHVRYKDKIWAGKFLGEFSEYFQRVVNPAIDNFMIKNIAFVNAVKATPNELGTYGMATKDFVGYWDLNEKLYFSIVSDNIQLSKELIILGADPSSLVFDCHKNINVALKRGQFDLVKFMCDNSDTINLDSVDIHNKNTIQLAQELGEEAQTSIASAIKIVPEVIIAPPEVTFEIASSKEPLTKSSLHDADLIPPQDYLHSAIYDMPMSAIIH